MKKVPHEPSDSAQDIQKWLNRMAKQHDTLLAPQVKNAAMLAQIAGEDQPTFTGESCLKQGMLMAEILASLNMDKDTVAAAIVYPSVQYNQLTLADIEEELNKTVMKLVRGVEQMEAVHSLYHYSDQYQQNTPQLDNLRRMLLAIVEDVRVVIIKLAERLAIMRKLRPLQERMRQRLAQETMDIYAPLANRLGIGQLKWELEDLAFRYLEPEAYAELAAYLDEKREDREKYVIHLVNLLKECVSNAGIEPVEITGRAKHIYSIFRKMQRKNVTVQEIYDITAVRVLVPTVADCYAVLSIVHSLWAHIPSEFDDYIAHPKNNGYRSIHTALHGPQNKNIEVQIRTHDMHSESELGVAAHWMYKEAATAQKGYEAKIALLRQILEWQKNVAHQNEDTTQLATGLLDDRIYVFTPAGEVLDLATGATTLDFAYHIHSELGNHCRGAKINGKMVPITYQLQTGERVEILTSRTTTPSRDWLNPHLGYLKTARARTKVHQWFKQQDLLQNIEDGRAYLEKEMRRIHQTNVDFEQVAHKLKLQSANELFVGIATHDLKLNQILNILANEKSKPQAELSNLGVITSKPTQGKSTQNISVRGVDNILTHTAQCCKPIPGDAIKGFITRGRGISVHHQDCPNLIDSETNYPERMIDVSWDNVATSRYPVDLSIESMDRPGLIRDISGIFANEKINVLAMQSKSNPQNNTHLFTLTIEISDIQLLDRLIDRIRQLPDVYQVTRKY